jgi:protein TonB
MDQDELFGVLEIFSPQPHAFGQRDVYTLRALTYRILENRRQARQAVLQETSGSVTEVDTMVAQTPEPSATPPADAAEKATAWAPSFSAGLSARHPSFPSSDTLTTVLGVIVIGAAVVLGTLIGWRFGWQEAAMKARAISTRQSNTAAARASLNPAASQSKESQPSVVPFTSSVPAPAASKPELSATAIAPAEPPPGGLVVYQKGKVVFRLIPSSTAGQQSPSQTTPSGLQTPTAAGLKASVPEVRKLSQEAAAARLIHRVLPQYPAQARDQQLQGPVLLDVQIGPDGNVQQVGVVQGNPLLAEAAVAAVKQWQYQPYEINGQRILMQTRVTVNFKLKD